eukprot:10210572-Karenia_brevis.AAC.1
MASICDLVNGPEAFPVATSSIVILYKILELSLSLIELHRKEFQESLSKMSRDGSPCSRVCVLTGDMLYDGLYRFVG